MWAANLAAACRVYFKTPNMVMKYIRGWIMNQNITEADNAGIPIERKLNLTVREASEYSNIGINKINDMLRNPMCEFVLYVGNRKLVKRREFEEYLSKRTEI